uniref:Estradiol 17-beta-dehydrogenase 11 n=1 Tax=Marmota marmota marmota TaxID=9994 RepID=A0A8C5YVI0_MARMA
MNFLVELVLLLPLLFIFYLESFVKLFIPKKGKSVTGEIVLITVAGYGIGRLTAYEFAKLKSKLVFWDINKYEIGDISILVNNAGVVYTSDLFSTQDSQIEKTFAVNTLAHFWTTKAFLPSMMKNNDGHIVTVASAAGLIGVPFLLAYCSSKFAAVGFHGALTEELNAFKKNGIKTTCFCPNFINTEVVKKLMNGILTEKRMVLVPSSLNFLLILEKFLPQRFREILKRRANIMDAVIGYKVKEQ